MIFYVESLQNKRSANEDSYCHMDIRVNHEAKVSAYAIADGMGGLEAGKQYSSGAVSLWFQELVKVLMGEPFKECSLRTQIDMLVEFSKEVFHRINESLYQKGMDAGIKGGTTLTTAIHFWDTWIIGNCGDSPVYAMKEGSLCLCSEIQNVAWKMVREGKTQIGSTVFYQNKNKLLEYLGKREEIHPSITKIDDQDISALLLGTDGAFGDLSIQKLQNIIKGIGDPAQVVPAIMEFARSQGEMDNQTAIYVLSDKKKEKKEVRESDPYVVLQEKQIESTPIIEEKFEKKEEICYREIPKESFGNRCRQYLRAMNSRKGKKGGTAT